LRIKKLESFGFWVFVGDVISGVGSDIFGQGHRAWTPTAKDNILNEVFIGN